MSVPATQSSLADRMPFREGQLSVWNLRRLEIGFSPATDVLHDHIILLPVASVFLIC